jgi:hypothetical protein
MTNDYLNLPTNELVSLLQARDANVASQREHILWSERQRISVADDPEEYQSRSMTTTNEYITGLERKIEGLQGANENGFSAFMILSHENAKLRKDIEALKKKTQDGSAAPSTNFNVGTFSGNFINNNNYYIMNPYGGVPANVTAYSALPLRPATIMPSPSATSNRATLREEHATVNDTAVEDMETSDNDNNNDDGDDIRPPLYSDGCLREARGELCRNNTCKYLHKHQLARYSATLHSLFKNAAEAKKEGF